jgi:hypothetical protein
MTTLNVDTWQAVDGTSLNRCLQTVTGIANDTYTITTSGTAQFYYDTPITVNITSKKANSKFFLMSDVTGYITSTDCACNTGFSRNYSGSSRTLVQGVNGSSGDSWMGFGNSNAWGSSTSWNMQRHFLDAPNVPKGTILTYTVTFASWTPTAGQRSIGWGGYVPHNKIIVLEIEA